MANYIFRKIITRLLLGLVLLVNVAVGESRDVVFVAGTYLKAPYKITLFNVRSKIASYLLPPLNHSESGLFWLNTIGARKFDYVLLPLYHPAVSSVLYVRGVKEVMCSVESYDQRIKDRFKWHNLEEKRTIYKPAILLKNGSKVSRRTGEDYVQNFGHVPVAVYDGKECAALDFCTSLFDLFTQEVDKYLFTFGIGEMIDHEEKKKEIEYQKQISLLGAIEIDSLGYFSFGFFQYTFNKQGDCYHRAFKPWNYECLMRLSNAETQAVIHQSLCAWLSDLEQNGPFGGDTVDAVIDAIFKRHSFYNRCLADLKRVLDY